MSNSNDGTNKPSPRNEKAVLNTMGTAQVVSAAEHHLAGAGALVRQQGRSGASLGWQPVRAQLDKSKVAWGQQRRVCAAAPPLSGCINMNPGC
mgnify:CR=1 FL=1